MRRLAIYRALRVVAAAALMVAGCGRTEPPAEPPASADVASEATSLVVAGGTVLTLDAAATVIENGAVAIAGGTIAAVGPTAEIVGRFPQARILPATGKIVMPGLINAHTHVAMTLFAVWRTTSS